MLRRILINATSTHLRIAITEDGKLVELFTESPDTEHHVGNIYLGRVTRVVQGMNAAFVNIGLEQDGFLHFSDVDSTMEEDASDDDDDERPSSTEVQSADVALRTSKVESRKKKPTFSTKRSGEITINIHAKQMVVVQVTRDAYHQKGVRITTKVGLTGRNVVLLPFESSIGISRKIYQTKERKRLRAIAKSIIPEGMGCIIRTAAAGLPEEDVARDFPARDPAAQPRERRAEHQARALLHRQRRDQARPPAQAARLRARRGDGDAAAATQRNRRLPRAGGLPRRRLPARPSNRQARLPYRAVPRGRRVPRARARLA